MASVTSTATLSSLSSNSANPGVALVWKNLSVYDPNARTGWPQAANAVDREPRRILKGINGAIGSNSLTAIMGPSGAGKTTLLKCLFGTSSIRYSGHMFVSEKGTKAVFITQNEEDHLLMNLTVEESLRFASKVKNASNSSKGSKTNPINVCRCVGKCIESSSSLVHSLIEQLGLERCRNTLVGKCSGGQKKRLAIAQELASEQKPRIIFMDEPTSGIDSSVSYLVLRQLQQLSRRAEISIVATIHQPSYKILELFDQLYILSRRGRCIYNGTPSYLRPHLLRYSLPCPDGHNPADVVIELASTETRKECNTTLGCFEIFFARCRSSKDRELSVVTAVTTMEVQKVETLEKVAEIECEEIVAAICTKSMFEVRKLCSYQVSRSYTRVWFLFRRCLVNNVLREPRWLLIRTLFHVLVAFVLSFLYNDQIGKEAGCLDMTSAAGLCHCSPQKTLEGLSDTSITGKNVAFLFFNLLFLMFAALMPTVLTFPSEMKVFLNEHRNGWYNTRSYFVAKSVVEFLVQLPLPYFYSMYMYWWTAQPGLDNVAQAIPFWEASRFKTFVSITLLATFVAQGVGFLIGAVFAYNFNISIFVSTIFMLFNFLFAGFFIRISQMGSVEFLTRFSFTRFAFEAILLTVYGEERCGGGQIVLNSTMSTFSSMLTTTGSSSFGNISEVEAPSHEVLIRRVASTVLHQFELDENQQSSIFNNALIWLLIHLVGWRALTYVTLWWKVNPDSAHRKIFAAYFIAKKSSRRRTLTVLFCLFLAAVIATVIAVILIK